MMKVDLGGLFDAAGDFLRRHRKSAAVRAAEKRRDARRRQDAARRAKQSGAVAGVSAVGAFGYALTVAPLASAAVASGAVAVAALALVQLWRSRGRDPSGFSREELTLLPMSCEEWLLDQRLLLPPDAEPPLDTILVALGDLPLHLSRLDPASTLAWEVRRLLGDHLPTLVAAWCELPQVAREADHGARQRLVQGLSTIASELARLSIELSRDPRSSLETRSRFLDLRYGDGLAGR